ncbi:MAG: YIP1 family protein [Candidatus Marinimicrobia bacterium]|nr:YIP1 family protein [Candidatus Neomarinimicrobiota bacterium]
MNTLNEVKEVGLLSKIISIFWEPSKTFKSISQKTHWWDVVIPILLITIVTWITIPYIAPVSTEMAKDRIQKSERLNETQKEQALENIENQNPVFRYVMPPISNLIMIAVIAAVMWMAGNFFLSGERKFLPVLGMTSYVYLINILASAVKTPLIVSKNSMEVYTGLATIIPKSDSFLFRVAMHVDIFAVWKVVLLGIGLGILYKTKQSRSLKVSFAIWIIYILGASAAGGLSPF